MERQFGILGEAFEKEFEECVDVLSNDRAVVDCRSVISVGETNVDGLVEEDDVGLGIPAEFVESYILSAVCDSAGTEFEEQTCGRGAAWSAVEP